VVAAPTVIIRQVEQIAVYVVSFHFHFIYFSNSFGAFRRGFQRFSEFFLKVQFANFEIGANTPQTLGRPARSRLVAPSSTPRSEPAAPSGSAVLAAFPAAINPEDIVSTTAQIRAPVTLLPKEEFAYFRNRFASIGEARRQEERARLLRLWAALETAANEAEEVEE
jgi:hypothetical protein